MVLDNLWQICLLVVLNADENLSFISHRAASSAVRRHSELLLHQILISFLNSCTSVNMQSHVDVLSTLTAQLLSPFCRLYCFVCISNFCTLI